MGRKSPVISVLGAGSWGTALAILLARNGAEVRLWGHLPDHIETLRAKRENPLYLPGIELPERLHPTPGLEASLRQAEEVLIVVPSHAFRAVLASAAPFLTPGTSLSWATKGLEPGTGKMLHQIAGEVMGAWEIAVISGPSFAKEVALGLPTAITIAAGSGEHARRLGAYLNSDCFRTYTSDDMVGVQLGGCAKNVLAIAAGISDGLGFGANARAALITRGLAELTRLGLAMGGKPETFMGLAGLGDLVLTCTDDQSRNRRMGLALARGLTIEEALREIGQEVEGVRNAREVYHKAGELNVEMPITEQVHKVLYEAQDPREAVQTLLQRRPKAEGE